MLAKSKQVLELATTRKKEMALQLFLGNLFCFPYCPAQFGILSTFIQTEFCFFLLDTQKKINQSHHIGNASIFQPISHNTGKCNKTHFMKKAWEAGTHTLLIVWVLFSHWILFLWNTSYIYRKSMVFPINFLQYSKMQQNPSYRDRLVLILFPQYEQLFPMRLSSYGILHHIGNAQDFS